MAILATTTTTQRELIPTGNYVARCYQMIELGTISETINGKTKILKKVRIGWELPEEMKVFNEELGPQPRVISKEYTLSMYEKSSLRKDLKSWRGRDFTNEEAESFDITKLLGAPCMINIIHKPGSKDPSKMYEEISGITSVPKSTVVPPQINPTFLLEYDSFDLDKYNKLPDFIKGKMKDSLEFAAMQTPNAIHMQTQHEGLDDLPF